MTLGLLYDAQFTNMLLKFAHNAKYVNNLSFSFEVNMELPKNFLCA